MSGVRTVGFARVRVQVDPRYTTPNPRYRPLDLDLHLKLCTLFWPGWLTSVDPDSTSPGRSVGETFSAASRTIFAVAERPPKRFVTSFRAARASLTKSASSRILVWDVAPSLVDVSSRPHTVSTRARRASVRKSSDDDEEGAEAGPRPTTTTPWTCHASWRAARRASRSRFGTRGA